MSSLPWRHRMETLRRILACLGVFATLALTASEACAFEGPSDTLLRSVFFSSAS